MAADAAAVIMHQIWNRGRNEMEMVEGVSIDENEMGKAKEE